MLIAFNKPFRVLTQFTDRHEPARTTLAEFALPPDVYAAGRLDFDSEGLLLLTDDGKLAKQLTQPRGQHTKVYWSHVEGQPTQAQLEQLSQGVILNDGPTLPAGVRAISPPRVWPRTPPIRERRSIPDSWLEITLTEGRNRQVRRMTASVGLPTLRLIRVAIGPYGVDSLLPGQWRVIQPHRGQGSKTRSSARSSFVRDPSHGSLCCDVDTAQP